jgi:antirestriction factor ArdC-like protein/uncharacterized protein DUF955
MTTEQTTPTATPFDFAALLREALEQPGTINRAYFAFHNFSLGNQLLAMCQCAERGIAPGPLCTFPGWKEKGRHVLKGSKAIMLCMPVTCKRKPTDAAASDTDADDTGGTFTRFIYRPHWFVLAQTDGAAYQPEPLPTWDKARALAALDITEEAFTHVDGNTFGYAKARTIAVSPLCPRPWRTLFHELAHVVLGHTDQQQHQTDGPELTRSTREVEAEGTAYLVAAALDLPGAEDSRGYLNHWRREQPVDEPTARRIFKTADTILRAGRASIE